MHSKPFSYTFTVSKEAIDFNGKYYTEEQMITAYKNKENIKDKKERVRKTQSFMRSDNNDFWARVSDFDCVEMLSLLS